MVWLRLSIQLSPQPQFARMIAGDWSNPIRSVTQPLLIEVGFVVVIRSPLPQPSSDETDSDQSQPSPQS